MSDKKEKNYYEILEISTSASEEEIHRGYIQAKNIYVQDSVALYSLLTKEECEKILEQIEEAYTILSDPTKRAKYNTAKGIEAQEADFTELNITAKEEQERHRRQEIKKHSSKPRPPSPDKHSDNVLGTMSKIVANKRFTLEYTTDLDIEKRIERAEDFSGKFLKEIREYKNVDLPRMSDMTKVSKTYLRNIESDNWKNLPAKAYIRGFVYQYAKCLKLNPDMVSTSYVNRIKTKK